jgi:hypothetical protein
MAASDVLSARDALPFPSQEKYSQGKIQQPFVTSPAPVWQPEFDRFVQSPRVAKHTEVLRWWDENEHRYPHLPKVAQDYLAIPWSSLASERVFSWAGDLITKKRNRVARRTANTIMCLHCWLHMPEATKEDKCKYNWCKLEKTSHSREEDEESESALLVLYPSRDQAQRTKNWSFRWGQWFEGSLKAKSACFSVWDGSGGETSGTKKMCVGRVVCVATRPTLSTLPTLFTPGGHNRDASVSMPAAWGTWGTWRTS